MEEKNLKFDEKIINPVNGMIMLMVNLVLILGGCLVIVLLAVNLAGSNDPLPLYDNLSVEHTSNALQIAAIVFLGILVGIVSPILLCGLRVVGPNEALVLTLFGNYYGTIKKAGFYWINPFCVGVNPLAASPFENTAETVKSVSTGTDHHPRKKSTSKKISMKTMTLNNDKQKVNDLLGNPIIIGMIVTWKIENTVKAVFNVDNYEEFISIQGDSALRNVARLYPYDVAGDEDEKTLRGSSQEVSDRIRDELQKRVEIAGIKILEARITHLAYAPEIAAAMLQRQQASAIVDARMMIVDGAVGMVEMALEKLNENEIVQLDEERKAAMVSNLLVVLCGNKDAQPIVNSGSIY